MMKYGHGLIGHGTVKPAASQNKLMSWSDFLHAGSNAIIFG